MSEPGALFDPDDWLEDEAALVIGAGGLPASGDDELALDRVVPCGAHAEHHRPRGDTDRLAERERGDRAAVEQALQTTQAWSWRDRSLGALSGGERQRVLLARALAVQAQVPSELRPETLQGEVTQRTRSVVFIRGTLVPLVTPAHQRGRVLATEIVDTSGNSTLDRRAEMIARAQGRRTVPLLQPARDALLALGPGAADALVFPGATGAQRKSGDDAGWADWCSSRRRSPSARSTIPIWARRLASAGGPAT